MIPVDTMWWCVPRSSACVVLANQEAKVAIPVPPGSMEVHSTVTTLFIIVSITHHQGLNADGSSRVSCSSTANDNHICRQFIYCCNRFQIHALGLVERHNGKCTINQMSRWKPEGLSNTDTYIYDVQSIITKGTCLSTKSNSGVHKCVKCFLMR